MVTIRVKKHIRVEKHLIQQHHPYYELLDKFCFYAKNLYNFANYQIRQSFFTTGRAISYTKLDKLLKQEGMDNDYRHMPTAQSAQQLLKLLTETNWKSFFAAMKDWRKNKEKYTGKPKPPKYLKKNGRQILTLTNQNCKLKEGKIYFPKSFRGFQLKTNIKGNLQQVRFLPRNKYIIVEAVYRIDVPQPKDDNGRYLSIDLGLDNFATIVNNVGFQPIVINGKGLKSKNQYYNKKMGYYRSLAKRMNG
jgi:putative transposase